MGRVAETRTKRAACGQAALPVLATVAAALYLSVFLRTNWQIGDEGTILHGAQRVLQGEIPSRDFFEVMGPGSFLSMALWFKLLGISWFTSRIALLLASLGSGLAIYYIAARRCTSAAALLPAAFYTVMTIPLWPGANHHFESNLWVLLAVATAAGSNRLDSARGLLTGILLGVAATIMPQKGLLCVAALALSAVLQHSRDRRWTGVFAPLFSMAAGFALVGMLIAAFFSHHHALGDLWYANVVWPASQYHSVNVVSYGFGLVALIDMRLVLSLFPPAIAPIAMVALLLPFAFVALLPGFCAVILARHFRTILAGASVQPELLTVGLVGAALFVSELHRPDMMHLIYGSPLFMILVSEYLVGSKSRGLAVARRALACCVLLLAAVLAVKAAVPRVKVETRRGTVYMREQDAALQFIQENVPAGENVFLYPYSPMHYFLADVRNPTRYSILMYHMNTESQFEEVIRALATKRVNYVLHDLIVAGENLKRWFPGYTHPSEDRQVVERYLAANYRELMVTKRFRILQRLQETSPVGAQ